MGSAPPCFENLLTPLRTSIVSIFRKQPSWLILDCLIVSFLLKKKEKKLFISSGFFLMFFLCKRRQLPRLNLQTMPANYVFLTVIPSFFCLVFISSFPCFNVNVVIFFFLNSFMPPPVQVKDNKTKCTLFGFFFFPPFIVNCSVIFGPVSLIC